MSIINKELPNTRFAVITLDGSQEWAGTRKGFVDAVIPTKGIRYKTFGGALEASGKLLALGIRTRVIETLL